MPLYCIKKKAPIGRSTMVNFFGTVQYNVGARGKSSVTSLEATHNSAECVGGLIRFGTFI